jgi:hypothetical protein
MANFSLDLISKGLPKFVAKIQTEQPVDDFLQRVLFGGSVALGSEGVDGVAFDWRKKAPGVVDEALRGADPTRVNFQTGFNSGYVVPNYYHMVDIVSLSDADQRVFGEAVSDNVDSQARVTRIFADKVAGMKDSTTMAKEQMCADAIFNGSVVNRNGTQTFPMTSALLNVSGANLTSNFNSVISTAFDTVRKKNKAFRATALILNPTDAVTLVAALGTLINKETFDLGRIAFGQNVGGATLCGTVNTPAGLLAIYAYYGVNASGTNYIAQGKGILTSGKIGGFAYGRIRAFENGKPCYRVAQERMVAYEVGNGDMRHYEVEYQTAPLPLITNIDGYCVLNSIS